MDISEFMIWKLFVLGVIVFCWRFYLAVTGQTPPARRDK
jgi:hypothetical protein